MRFSIYSEIQYWGDKTPKRAYDEVIEQVVHADRLGYDAYGVIEHFFFPKFSISANPFALWGQCAARTRNIKFRTLGHVLPYHNPTILASQIAAAGILFEGRYEFGALRGHGWIPAKAGVPIRETPRPLRGVAGDPLPGAARRALLLRRHLLHDRRRPDLAAPRAQVPRVPGRHERPYLRARGRERLGRRRAAAPPLRGAQGPARPLPRQVRRARHRAGHRLDPRLLHRRGPRHGAARGRARHAPVPRGQRVAADRPNEHLPPAEDMDASGYGFYISGIMEKLAQTPLRGDDRRRHRLGRHPRATSSSGSRRCATSARG